MTLTRKRALRSAELVIAILFIASPAWGEVFLLKSGGEVHGELVNKDQAPRVEFVVKTVEGGQVTLAADQVKSRKPQNAAEVKYDHLKLTAEDTIKGQWALAEYCRENTLLALRKPHLERILELDTNHEGARRALGYSKVKGKWVTQEAGNRADGRVRYKGEWRTRQEKQLMEQADKAKNAQQDWYTKLKRWKGWLHSNKAADARANIEEINDPFATKALTYFLKNEESRELKMMWIDALARVHNPAAMDTLVSTSLADPDEEVRIACMEKLREADYKPAVQRYIQTLKHKDNEPINLAAQGLGYMKDTSAIPALISALVTTHKYTIQPASQPGQMQSTFGGGGGGGFTFGQAPAQIEDRQHQNAEVLRTLVALAGVNFDFDVPAWKYWYANQKKPATLDARRDEK